MQQPNGVLLVRLTLILYQVAFYFGNEMLRTRPDHVRALLVSIPVYFLVTIASALLMPRLFDKPASKAVDAISRPGRAAVAAAAVILLANIACRMTPVAAWRDSVIGFLLSSVGFSFLSPFIYYLYFSRAPREHRGLWFGVSLAIGIAVKAATAWTLGPSCLALRLDEWHTALMFVIRVATTLLALTAFVGFLRSANIRSADAALSRNDVERVDTRARVKTMTGLGFACMIFYFMNGALSDHLQPFVLPEIDPQFGPLPILLVIVCPLVGHLLDRDRPRWFGRIARVCSLFFLLSPALTILGDSSRTYTAIHSLGAMGQFALLVSMTLVFAHLAGSGPRWCLLLCIPYLSRFMSLPGAVIINRFVGDNIGMLFVVSVVTAVLFSQLTQWLSIQARQSAAPTAPAVADNAPPVPMPIPIDILFNRYNLSARESEVATLVLEGCSTADIAGRLGITESTVNFHVKNILRKAGLNSRKAFIIAVKDASSGIAHAS